MACKGCGLDHSPMLRCDVFRRQQEATNPVVNEVSTVVVNRTKDRHKKTPERLAYVRQKMREHRAKKSA